MELLVPSTAPPSPSIGVRLDPLEVVQQGDKYFALDDAQLARVRQDALRGPLRSKRLDVTCYQICPVTLKFVMAHSTETRDRTVVSYQRSHLRGSRLTFAPACD